GRHPHRTQLPGHAAGVRAAERAHDRAEVTGGQEALASRGCQRPDRRSRGLTPPARQPELPRLFDHDPAEVDRRAFGLPADAAFLQLTLALGDLGPVDEAGQLAVLADDLDRVPLADRLARLHAGRRVVGELALGAADGEDLGHVEVHALDLDALRPD